MDGLSVLWKTFKPHNHINENKCKTYTHKIVVFSDRSRLKTHTGNNTCCSTPSVTTHPFYFSTPPPMGVTICSSLQCCGLHCRTMCLLLVGSCFRNTWHSDQESTYLMLSVKPGLCSAQPKRSLYDTESVHMTFQNIVPHDAFQNNIQVCKW